MKLKTFEPGARVRYTGKFLRSIGMVTGPSGKRRGTVVGPIPGMSPDIVGVRWDDEDLSDRADDPEFCTAVRTFGAGINVNNIGTVR
jgi:hypothetical protein